MRIRSPKPKSGSQPQSARKSGSPIPERLFTAPNWKFNAGWGNPSRQRKLARLLLSWLFYDPETFSLEELSLLAEVHRRLDRFAQRDSAPFKYKYLTSLLSYALTECANPGWQTLFKESVDIRSVRFLTEISTVVVNERRHFKSMLTTYQRLISAGIVLPVWAPEDAQAEVRNHSSYRIGKGYTDKGSRRPDHKWLPPPPPVEVTEEGPEPPVTVTSLEEFRKDTLPAEEKVPRRGWLKKFSGAFSGRNKSNPG